MAAAGARKSADLLHVIRTSVAVTGSTGECAHLRCGGTSMPMAATASGEHGRHASATAMTAAHECRRAAAVAVPTAAAHEYGSTAAAAMSAVTVTASTGKCRGASTAAAAGVRISAAAAVGIASAAAAAGLRCSDAGDRQGCDTCRQE